jgi:hypothetical protein
LPQDENPNRIQSTSSLGHEVSGATFFHAVGNGSNTFNHKVKMIEQELMNKIMDGTLDNEEDLFPKREHRQVSLLHPEWNEVIEVDEGISELIVLLWRAEVNTMLCCEENRPGYMFIRFVTAYGLEKFFNMLAINRDKELGNHDSLYHRVIDPDQEGGWEYDILVEDIGNEIDEAKDKVVYTLPPEVIFTASVLFPISDYPQVLKCVNQHLAINGQ